MTQAAEALGAPTPMGSDLNAGTEQLSYDQEITFTKYVRLVLPLDGYVFWVKASILSPSAIYNMARLNVARYGQAPRVITQAPTLVAKGSLHYATDRRQEAEETYAANRVVFTSEQPVQDLNAIAGDVLWLGEFDGRRFGFSSRSSFYQQADLWHYVGFAVYADMLPQIVDSPLGFDDRNVVVSNSLPAWLALNSYFPGYGFGNPGVTLYPSFLVPENIAPPFGAVDIPPADTQALASAPTIEPGTSSHVQLARDRVRVTLWGARNFNALDFLDCVNQYSTDVEAFGIMNIPTVRDEKRTQAELAAIAMKKTLDFEISYLQTRVRQVAKQMLKQVFVTYDVQSKAV